MNLNSWVMLDYKDIENNRYSISTEGKIKNIKNNEIIFGNNPKNEKGYVRVCLKTKSGKYKKFPLHVLVCSTFNPNKDRFLKNEVNHKDGNKLNNQINNLEWCTRKENALHASKNNLYKKCEKSPRATFTNKQIEDICKYFQQGISIGKIIQNMNLQNREYIIQYLNRIKNRETWTEISCKYIWNNDDLFYKTYKKEDIKLMCELISKGISIKEIIKYFNYNSKKLKSVLKKYDKENYIKISIKNILLMKKVQRLSKQIMIS
jgi:hypothetical protein